MKKLVLLFSILFLLGSVNTYALPQQRGLLKGEPVNTINSYNKTRNSGYNEGFKPGYEKRNEEYKNRSRHDNNRFYTDSYGETTNYYRY